MRNHWLQKRGGNWGFRLRVPDALRTPIGKREITKSFGPVSHAVAKRLAVREKFKADQLFAVAEANLRQMPTDSVPAVDLEHLARAYFQLLETQASPIPRDRDERAEELDLLEGELAGITQDDPQAFQPLVRSMCQWAKVRFDPTAPDFPALCDIVERAQVEHLHRQRDRLRLAPERRIDPIFSDFDRLSPPLLPPKPSITLGRAIEMYVNDPARAGVSAATRKTWTFQFRLWSQALGESTPVSTISREKVREARDLLIHYPSNAAKRYPGLGFEQAIAKGKKDDAKPLSAKSVLLYLNGLNSLFRYLVQEDIVAKSPVQGLGAPPVRQPDRRPWSVAELNDFLQAPPYKAPWQLGRQPAWRFFLPLIALFSGARLGEIVGLKAKDVQQMIHPQ